MEKELRRIALLNWRQSLLFFSVSAIVLIGDQVTKAMVRSNMELGESIPAEGRFRLTYSTNTGSVFGLPLDSTFLTIVAFLVVGIIVWAHFRYLSFPSRLIRIGAGLVLGGAIGNLIDRVRFGEVTDFIDVRLWGNFHWATFNIADAALTSGIIVLVYAFWEVVKAKR